ncbi:hypothetical protein [Leucobacter japonicus]|uniref:hypothetical protein n=1 Tax=Leucobacter japonicus TaxID=1461259 RepID=UPI0006A7A7D2|nr:hypothetical protein [Leucobacter japonicus]
MSLTTALRIVRVSAIYDLIVTAGFAFPFSAPLIFAGVAALQTSFGVSGSLPNAGDASTVMFANLMGGLVTVWALFRIVRPSLLAGAADTLGRAFFSMGMIAALLAGASPVIWIMLVLELAWGVVQGWAVVAAWRRARVATA